MDWRAVLDQYLAPCPDAATTRRRLTQDYPGLRPVFDFFGCRAADEFRLLQALEPGPTPEHEAVVFELFRTNDGAVVAGAAHHRVVLRHYRRDAGVIECVTSGGRAAKIRLDRAVVLVRPRRSVSRGVVDAILEKIDSISRPPSEGPTE